VRQFWDLANDYFQWQRDCLGWAGHSLSRCRERDSGSWYCALLLWALIVAACDASLLVVTGGGGEG
jgi:hypothetical protein